MSLTTLSYCTLPFLRQRQSLDSTDTENDQKLLQKIRAASRDIDMFTSRVFEPIKATHEFDFKSSTKLLFGDYDLLSLTSITDGQLFVIDNDSIILLGSSSGNPPYYGVELDPGVGSFFTYLTSKKRALSVVGVWGWHDDYTNAWHDSGVTIQGGGITTVGQTALTTSTNNSTITDSWGQTWKAALNAGTVQVGHLVKWGENGTEIGRVVAYPSATTLTVQRAVNGTTGQSTVAAGTAIYIYEPPTAIRDICAQWAAYLLAQDDTDFGKIAISATGEKTVPLNMRKVFEDRLEIYRRTLL